MTHAWRTDHLRLSAFPAATWSVDGARGWWKALTDMEPVSVKEEPQKGVVQIRGIFEDATLHLNVDGHRLDVRWLFTKPQGSLSTLPLFTGVLPRFVALTRKWLALKVPIQRLAFGAVVVANPSDRVEDCRGVLLECLPTIDMSETPLTDFLYQVNRRQTSTAIEDLEINRLTRWSVHHFQEVVADSSGGSITISSTSTFASRLELDINSDPRRPGQLRANRVVPLFEEFTELGSRIAAVGDRP